MNNNRGGQNGRRGRGGGGAGRGFNKNNNGQSNSGQEQGQRVDGGRGRGRGGGVSKDDRVEIFTANRPMTIQAASEATDDIIIAAPADEGLQGFASMALRRADCLPFTHQHQARRFINSCLLNLSNHHNHDVSGLLPALASSTGQAVLKAIIQTPMGIDAVNDRARYSFQYVMLPLVGVLTREGVCQSTLTTETSTIFSAIYLYRRQFLEDGIIPCMAQVLSRGSLEDYTMSSSQLLQRDRHACVVSSLQCALLAIVRLVYQLIHRFSDAKYNLANVVATLVDQSTVCAVIATKTEEDQFLNGMLVRESDRLQRIVSDAKETIIQPLREPAYGKLMNAARNRGPNLVHLRNSYDPPGNLSPDGSRHDNDFVEISEIKLLPSEKEVACLRQPFLPANGVPGAPHFLPDGPKRLIDTHFRLYREDMMDGLRRGIIVFLTALQQTTTGNEKQLLQPKELRKHDNNVSMNVYGNIQFLRMNTEKNLAGSIDISFSQPLQIPNNASASRRKEFWERSKSRLMQGGLVCLVRRTEGSLFGDEDAVIPNFEMALAVVTKRNIEHLSKDSAVARLSVTLTDPKIYLSMVTSKAQTQHGSWFLVESTGAFFESYRPILKALQQCIPATLPFGKYLAPTEDEASIARHTGSSIDPPEFAQAPGFQYDLSVLIKGRDCRVNANDQRSVDAASRVLQEHSTLDDTQASALLDTLCREVALINGPPGTGKTWIGVALMRVLLHNRKEINCGPIFCICLTNHALDQFLEHLLDAGIQDIVRVGSRSKSEQLEPYNMESLMNSRPKPFVVRQALAKSHEAWEAVSKNIETLEKALRMDCLPWEYVKNHLMLYYPDIFEQFDVANYHDRGDDDGDHDDEEFTRVASKKEKKDPSARLFDRWSTFVDLNEMKEWNERAKKDAESAKKSTQNMFDALNESGELSAQLGPAFVHPIPTSRRPVELLVNVDIWCMSEAERKQLIERWSPEVVGSMTDRLGQYLLEVEKIKAMKNEAFDEIRRGILRQATVIGMTTNGAAKHQNLVSAVAPKIIICEEAGEVLECHILAALTPSTQQLILIGDHKQLRPQIETYNLSSDSPIGKHHNLDMSLFERLVTAENPLPMSMLTTQRRMRPSISSLIRNTLYSNLLDGDCVFEYPSVAGMNENLFFLDHAHSEDAKDMFGAQSFSNTFEVKMIEALAGYLIKNGYNQTGDIAVLTPYLGQLSKLREGLAKSFTLVIDERDQEQLDQAALEDEASESEKAEVLSTTGSKIGVRNISLSRQLTLRTIDNYQGEEAKIVIISLVRNTVDKDPVASGRIGFLKSPNRTNVLLSRAQHGMFLLGNATLMENEKNGIWPKVIRELRGQDRVGDGFPLECKNHSDQISIVSTPEQLRIVAPNGGCILPCGQGMPCGHVCPLQCHPDDNEHRLVKCYQPCARLHPVCQHACPKECGQECGDCLEIMAPMLLVCGHIVEKPKCWQRKNPSRVICSVKVVRKLPTCEHENEMSCCDDPIKAKCMRPCGAVLECGHPCTKPCHECQKASAPATPRSALENSSNAAPRTNHGRCDKKCGRNLFCGHACSSPCHQGRDCPPCKEVCAARCAHSECKKECETLCAACCSPCVWKCPHQGNCNLPCGAPCDRLPCNKRCEKLLRDCGHQCPSVCGEKCVPAKYCVECKMDANVMARVVDMVMMQTLADVDVNDDPILLPSCGHAFTMSTLDGLMELGVYYKEQVDETTGSSTFVAIDNLPETEVRQVSCPTCRKPIVDILRYGRRVKFAQLGTRSKKFQIRQTNAMARAQPQFEVAKVKVENGQMMFLESLRLKPAVYVDCSSLKKRLGKFEKEADEFPGTNYTSIATTYGLSQEHEASWKKLIEPVTFAISMVNKIIMQSTESSPTKHLFDAAVSRLYQLKTTASFVPKVDVIVQEGEEARHSQVGTQVPRANLHILGNQASVVIQQCILECGLPKRGQAGSTYVDALQEKTNGLLVVLSAAQAAMQASVLGSGWYWLVEDLITCCSAYAQKTIETAHGQYGRQEAYARMNLISSVFAGVEWMGEKPIPADPAAKDLHMSKVEQLKNRFDQEVIVLRRECPFGIRDQLLQGMSGLEKKLDTAIKVAKGEIFKEPTKAEKLMIFRVIQREMGGAGHWYRCPNGHQYVIGECGMAMQESRCSECGLAVGGGDHELRADNAHDDEFERELFQQN